MFIFIHITVSLPSARMNYNTCFIYFMSSDSDTKNRPCTRAIEAEKLDFKAVHNLPIPNYNMPYSSVSFHTPQRKYKFYFDWPTNAAVRLTWPKIVFSMTRKNFQHSSCKHCMRTGNKHSYGEEG